MESRPCLKLGYVGQGFRLLGQIAENNIVHIRSQICPGFDTWSGNILSFLLPLFQEGQLSVTGESMCTKYWLTA